METAHSDLLEEIEEDTLRIADAPHLDISEDEFGFVGECGLELDLRDGGVLSIGEQPRSVTGSRSEVYYGHVEYWVLARPVSPESLTSLLQRASLASFRR